MRSRLSRSVLLRNAAKPGSRMSRIYYEVTASITDLGIADEWVRWMIREHIDAVVRVGATTGRLIRLHDSPSIYLVQYEFPSQQAFETYLATHAPRLRDEGRRRFEPEQVTYTRRSGEIVEP
jgi:hypothetical protein